MVADFNDPGAGNEERVSSRLSRRRALKASAAGIASMAWLLTIGHGGADLLDELARLAQGRPMTASRLATILRDERTEWNALLAAVGPSRIEIPGVEGNWSVKELVAHLTWYEQAVVEGAHQVMTTGAYTRRAMGAGNIDERNARIAAESRSRPVAEVLAEADAIFGQLLQVIAAIPDDILNDARLLGLPDDVPPWMRVANNSYAHYRQHEESVRVWLALHGSAQE